MPAVAWSREYELKALEALKAQAQNGKPFRFVGHPSKWLLTAICVALRDNGTVAYIPGLDAETPLKAFALGQDDGLSEYEIRERGDVVEVRFRFQDLSPVEMHGIQAPELPAGKDILIIATGHPILPSVCLAMAYADSCRSIWTTAQAEDTVCYCAVTNTDAYSLGEARDLSAL